MTRRGNEAAGAADAEAGAGERMERGRRLRRRALFGSLFAVGLLTGFYVGHSGRNFEALLGPDPIMSPAAAFAICALLLVAVTAGALLLQRNMDEHEKLTHYKAASVAGNAFLLTYIVWFNLWKGGVVPEPAHLVLFLVFLVAMGIGIFYYRFR
jgi:hypothetical protein